MGHICKTPRGNVYQEWPQDICARCNEKPDMVNHPLHYNNHPSGVECIEIARWMTYNLGAVLKYIWRTGKKDPDKAIEDLRKAAFYLNDEIERLEKLHEKTK